MKTKGVVKVNVGEKYVLVGELGILWGSDNHLCLFCGVSLWPNPS